MKSSTASVSSSDSIPKTAKINLCPSSMRMSVPPVEWRSLAYTGVIFPRKNEPCTHHQVGRTGLAGLERPRSLKQKARLQHRFRLVLKMGLVFRPREKHYSSIC